MGWLTFLHVLLILIALALAQGPNLYFWYAARDRDVPGMKRFVRWTRVSGALGAVAFLAGIGFGFAAALTGQFDLAAPWLLVTYALVVASMVFIVAVGGPWQRRLEAVLASSPDEVPSAELLALTRSTTTKAVLIGLPLIMVVIVFLMVVKPPLWT